MTVEPPRAVATIRADGNAEVVIDGVAQRVLATTLEQTRADVVARVAAVARAEGRAVQVDTYDPEGRFVLTVNPDGSLGEMSSSDLPEDTIPPAQATASAPEPPSAPAPQDPVAAWGPPGSAPLAPATPAEQTPPEPEQHAPVPYPQPAEPGGVASWMRTAATGPASSPPRPAESQQPAPAQQSGSPWTPGPQPAPQPNPQPQPVQQYEQYEQPAPPQQAAQQPQQQAFPPSPTYQGDAQGQSASAVGQFMPEQPMTRRQMRESFLKSEQSEAPASKGFRGTLARMGVRTQPSAAERAEREDIHAVSQHWPGVRTIAVVNGKGGANKSPSTALLAATFARYSGAATIAWDNNETRGTLGWRTEQGPHESTVLDLIPRTAELLEVTARAGDISHYVHHQAADKYDVLRSNPNLLSSEQRISGEDVDAIHDVLGRYYRLVFVDSGNDESAEHWLRMIDKADQLVVPTIAKPEHAEAGALLLEALIKRGGRSAELAQRAVVIVSQAREKDANPSAAEIARGFEGWVAAAVTIPFDRAMVENVLRFDSLHATTRRAWLRAAAAVARQL
ncbi:ATPase [Pseudactinotalea sp.]|uniref:MinD/ParA family ATP-binding protein n=1 Tax=Pseudactinotalea sp. TaxID=1926260 RepID=UPI003B3AFA0D